MKVKLSVEVNNVPDYPLCKYIVATTEDNTGELWYWGTWDDKEEAEYARGRVHNGVILERD